MDTINKGSFLQISSNFEFLCVWTLTYLHALVNNKTLSLLDFSSDGTTNIIIANISITNLGIANIRIANIGLANIRISNIGITNIRIVNISLANLGVANIRIQT
jgi:hypothetical protein